MTHLPRRSLWSRFFTLVEPIFRPLLLPRPRGSAPRQAPVPKRPLVETLEDRTHPGETVLPLLWSLSATPFAEPLPDPLHADGWAASECVRVVSEDAAAPPDLLSAIGPQEDAGESLTISAGELGSHESERVGPGWDERWLTPLDEDPFADPLGAARPGFSGAVAGMDWDLLAAAGGGGGAAGAGSSGGDGAAAGGGSSNSEGGSAQQGADMPTLDTPARAGNVPSQTAGAVQTGSAAVAPHDGNAAVVSGGAETGAGQGAAEAPQFSAGSAGPGDDSPLAAPPAVAESPVTAAAPNPAEADTKAAAVSALKRSPIRFERNLGQTDPSVEFVARGQNYGLFLTDDADAVLVLQRPHDAAATGQANATVVRMDLVGANAAPAVEGQDELATKSNYFRGSDPANWQTGISTFGRVTYRDVYGGIDICYYGTEQGQLEYDFIVAPGASPDAIRLAFDGADGVSLDGDGSLLVQIPGGDLRQHAPVIYQELGGKRVAIDGGYTITAEGQATFLVGAYDPALPLVIDPLVGYSTYLGGGSSDEAAGIAVDAAGNAYVTGRTSSTDFPTSTGAYDTSLAGTTDGFITKLEPSGGVAYSTYLGGVGVEYGLAIAVDSSGSAYLTGTAYPGFPTTSGAYDTTFNGNDDAFVTKLNSSGDALSYSTFLGGFYTDTGYAIAVDSSGNAYVTGTTHLGFPTTSGAYDTTYGGGSDAFVTKLNSAGSALSYSTYLGGSGNDSGRGIAVDSSGNAHVIGSTQSTNFPTASAAQSSNGGGQDGFLTKLNSGGTGATFSTYLGGSGDDSAGGIILDGLGNTYVTGSTGSSSATFPETPGAYQTELNGSDDAYVAEYNSSGSLTFATYLGGSGSESGSRIALTATGELVVGGTTTSTDFPMVNPVQLGSGGGSSDVFAARLNVNGDNLVFSTYWGGSAADSLAGMALDDLGIVHLAGYTESSNFPVLAAVQGTLSGTRDGFITKLALFPIPPILAPLVGMSASRVRYADGIVSVGEVDIASSGFGVPWGQSRTWTNAPGYATRTAGGTGSVTDSMPVLVPLVGLNSIAVLLGGTSALFFDLVSGSYVARFNVRHLLSRDVGAGEFTLTEPDGSKFVFYDFANSLPIEKRGRLKSYTNPHGASTSVTTWNTDGTPAEVQRSVTVGSDTHTESYLYAYIASGVNRGRQESVTLRRKVNSGSWSTVRKTEYAYYGTSEDFGNPGDLKTVTIKDSLNNVLDTTYHRYYKPGESNGYAGGLKYVFSPRSYARLAAAVSNPLTATDTVVAPYADRYFEYDSQSRVTKAVVQGAGSSTTSGGRGTFTYAYTTSTHADGFNGWKTKTVETLPDGNQNIVYSNVHGQALLSIFRDTTASLDWLTYSQYDSAGRLILSANPSAVSGYDDTKADLLNNQSGNYQHLRDSAGLITKYSYYSTTTATGTSGGGVAGLLESVQIQRGEQGTAVPQQAMTYFARSANGTTITPTASETVYRNTNGTGAITTSYAYSWHGTTAQPESLTVTLPTVSTTQNGSNTTDTAVTFFNTFGQPIWHKDPDGFLHYTVVDPITGAATKTIADVDTTRTSEFTGLPSGWSTPSGGGAHLVAEFEVDALGRATKTTDPAGNVTYTVYKDADREIRVYAGWDSTTNTATGPTVMTREDRDNGYYETVTFSSAPAVSGGRPTGTESITTFVQSLARQYTNLSWQVTDEDLYVSFSGTYYHTAVVGTEGSHYHRTRSEYDARGRRNRVQTPTGTIHRTVFDAPGRPISEWVGTDDVPTSGTWSPTNNSGANMVQVSALAYDSGAVGDSNLTQRTLYPGGGAAARVSQFYYDWRNRLVASKEGVEGTESTSLNRPLAYTEYDNLGAVAQELYDGDTVSISDAGGDGVPDKPSSSLLRARTTTDHDDRLRPYRSSTFSVDQSTGTVSTYALTFDTWYGKRGQVLKTAEPGGLVHKAQYDGAGRVTKSFVSDGGGDSGYSDADDVTGDKVLEQTETTYDGAGNAILVAVRRRFHDETGTGELGTASTGVKARVSYAAAYFDAAHRPVAQVDVGTNGGGAYTRPAAVPSRSDTVLVTSQTYDAAGRVDAVTDPRGIVNRRYYDAAGQVLKSVEAYANGIPDDANDKTTEHTYDGSGHLLTVTAHLTSGSQTTQFVYGVTTGSGSDLNSNDLLAEVRRPDKSTGAASTSEKEVYTANALGQARTFTDRNGNVHTYSFDVVGRPTADAVTTLGGGVDGSVRRQETAYDTAGRPYLFTAYDAASAGNVVNQVQQEYNGLGQLTKEYQEHAGAVSTSTSLKAQYAYAEMPSGANHSRMTAVTYPGGKALTLGYGSGLDDDISRLSTLADGTATLEGYSYLGLGATVIRSRTEPGIELTYVKQSGESNGDAGDQYTGLDRFGQIVDQRWRKTSDGSHTDRFQYGYDRNGNRLYRDNLLNNDSDELYHANGASAGYDQFDQLTEFRRGPLSDTNSDSVPDTVTTAGRSQSWDFDAQGNWEGLTTDGSAASRTHNRQNQVTGVGAATLLFDNNGNLTKDEAARTFAFDAWNRLATVKNSGGTTIATYKHDALGRRITETVSGTTRELYYSSAWQLIEERVGGSVKTVYVWGATYIDELVLRERDTDGNGSLDERLYGQQDANHNVTALVSASGSVQERYAGDPYGKPIILAPDWSSRGSSSYVWVHFHQGGKYEGVTELYVYRNRDLSASLGRWLENDPAGFGAGDTNLYRYVAADPVGALDPSGLSYVHSSDPTNQLLNRIFARGEPTRAGSVGTWEGNSYAEAGQQASRMITEDFPRVAAETALTVARVVPGPIGVTANGISAVRNAAQGRWGEAALDTLMLASRLNPCSLGTVGGAAVRGVNAGMAVSSAGQFVQAVQAGDTAGAVASAFGVFMHLAQAFRPCFPAEVPVLTPEGEKRAEEVRAGDLVLSSPEDDAEGPVEARVVEEVFVRVSPLLSLHVGGQVIRATPEHPFYVSGRGWVPTAMLGAGDLLRSHDGQWVAVEEVIDNGEVETVYNFRVAEWHTYFVGSRAWGFSVWAHNASYSNANPATRPQGDEFRRRAQQLWRTLPEGNRLGATVAVARVDGVEIVALYANRGSGARQFSQRHINRFMNRVREEGGVPVRASGSVHAEEALHRAYPTAPAIGISNRRGPCDTCGRYFEQVGYYNVHWPD